MKLKLEYRNTNSPRYDEFIFYKGIQIERKRGEKILTHLKYIIHGSLS